ncbi:DUF4105 domain-containing protein [Cellulophaga baltica]|uniref:lipoprotein N-acyltransferase Lnb domain-containing protein n=1 Tax=Cellulophaga TaxID=104264 RepID=UPI001C0746C7|nr:MULTISPECIES: DUF4105 domain-containing protein [Cellulophaga]MBU2996557.1 DUF4105 domain-containing protein [Cellulophaga baltica]MDO6767951.1 DUF4105 domain-containing protein [Cellulophaga sp. 1_MG-2023]
MKLKSFFFILFFTVSVIGYCQPKLTTKSTISILTVGTADELYAKFGHSAIRIKDPSLGIDVVYNYGHFDFNTPNFYYKFTRGKLLYELSRGSFSRFMYSYEVENRWVKEQKLNLTLKEKNDFLAFLEDNYKPDNRFYKYDFLFDNCSTRIPNALKTVLGDKLSFDYSHLTKQYTFRELLQQNLEVNSWSNFGIDLALGSVIDREATPWEHLFLPIYVYKQLPYTEVGGKNIVTSDKYLLGVKPRENNDNFITSPLVVLAIFLNLVALITYLDYKNDTRSKWLDFIIFFITGIAGLLIVFLWLGTDHKATANNFNFLWTFPLNIVLAFFILKDNLPKWVTTYLYTLIGFLVLAMIIWIFKVQDFSILILPIVILLAIRYSFLIYKQRSARVH